MFLLKYLMQCHVHVSFFIICFFLFIIINKLLFFQVLIITPTREIATQICSVVKSVGSSFRNLTVDSFIGGLPVFADQEKALETQIVVGTPGEEF